MQDIDQRCLKDRYPYTGLGGWRERERCSGSGDPKAAATLPLLSPLTSSLHRGHLSRTKIRSTLAENLGLESRYSPLVSEIVVRHGETVSELIPSWRQGQG